MLWKQTVGGTDDDQLNGMVKDADGNLYVVGSVQSAEQALMRTVVTKYTNGGVERWSKTIHSMALFCGKKHTAEWKVMRLPVYRLPLTIMFV